MLRPILLIALLFLAQITIAAEEPDGLEVIEHPPVPWRGSNRRRHSENAWKGAATLYGGVTESPQFTRDVMPVTVGAQFDGRIWGDLSAGTYFLTYWDSGTKSYNFGLALQQWRLFRTPFYLGIRLGAMLLDAQVISFTTFSGGAALGLDIPVSHHFSFGVEFAAFQTLSTSKGTAPDIITLPATTSYHGFVALRYNYRDL